MGLLMSGIGPDCAEALAAGGTVVKIHLSVLVIGARPRPVWILECDVLDEELAIAESLSATALEFALHFSPPPSHSG